MKNMIRIGQWAVLVGGLLLAGCYIHIGGCQSRASCERTLELQHPLEAGSVLKLHTDAGSIKIRGQEASQCTGVAKVRVYAPTQEEADEIAQQVSVSLEPRPGQLEIKSDTPRRRGVSVSISYELAVPVQTSVLANTASGSIRLAHLQGDMEADTASGSIRVADLGQGSVTLKTASGSIRVERATLSSCQMRTASGSLTGEQINCPDIVGNTASGSIKVACTPETSSELRADLSTSSGSVRLDLPQGFSGKVELSTHSGSVTTGLPVTVTGKVSKRRLAGTVGDGTGHVCLSTASGSVTLN